MAFYKLTDGTVYETDYPARDAVKLTIHEGKTAIRSQAVMQLRAMLAPGQTVYTVLRHRSASGMSRRISLCIVQDGTIQDITHTAARAMGDKMHADGGIIVSGCGMDMGFHLVYNLGRTVWPNGTDNPHGTRNGKPDTDGGYALKHQWL